MANSVYLSCALKEHTYPSFQESDFDSDEQTLAYCEHLVPLLWLAVFRPEDIRVDELRDEDGKVYREPAPVVARSKVAARLKEAVPRIEAVFPKNGSLKHHSKALADAVKPVDKRFRWLTMELQEVASMIDAKKFYASVEKALQFMGGEEVPKARDLLVELSDIHADRKFHPPSAFAEGDLEDEDEQNLVRLLGDELMRPVPWFPKPKKPVISELCVPIKAGNIEEVRKLLDNGADPNGVCEYGVDVLSAAAKSAPEVVPVLLEKGAKMTDGAVAYAAEYAPARILTVLLKAGGDPNIIACLGLAAKSTIDSGEKIRMLLDAGADVNFRSKASSLALEDAMRTGNLEAAQLFLAHGMDPVLVAKTLELARVMPRFPRKEEFIRLVESHVAGKSGG
jgi:hypothetical protein